MVMFRKGVELPSRILILLSIAIVVFLALVPLITEFVETGKSLEPKNLLRQGSLRSGFNKWVGNINDLNNADSSDIWEAYYNTKAPFLSGTVELWRLCQFSLQEKGEDFTFKNCWNYGVENYLEGENPGKYKLVAVDCPGCWDDKEREYVYKGKIGEFRNNEVPYNYKCEESETSQTNILCYPKGIAK
ncbi:MAG: hypothetical protein ABEK36_00665 [Candidatus Aenigmatarchaeota archaeon]